VGRAPGAITIIYTTENKMNLDIIGPLGNGSFGDVWSAKDELGRTVAVKIIREASEGVANALTHARALARAAHPNVVAVLTVDRVIDPVSNQEKDCVVMELLEGMTLDEFLLENKFSTEDLQIIGNELIAGLKHIHDQGMTHGDLHADNIIICNQHVKIIDILYLNTLALLSTGPKESRIKRDLISIRLILQQLINHSNLSLDAATQFNNLLQVDASIKDIEVAFLSITSVEETEQRSLSLDHFYSRIIDPDFVESEQYAEALLDELPEDSAMLILQKIANEDTYEYKHEYLVSGLWSLTEKNEREEFLIHLSEVLDKVIPKGKWPPSLRLLQALGTSSWNELKKATRIRIESLIIKDVLAGYKDIFGGRVKKGGSLGTYATTFWRYFDDKVGLANNLISMLRQSWYTQNYVASFFMHIIPELAETTETRNEFIEAFTVAKSNDARIVIKNLPKLPNDWVDAITNST
tara:strand:+ start:1399 stop:2799 length:1401 start_codon:yes stop_codon:yes gene_type:complete